MKKLYIFLIIFLFSIFLVPRETYALTGDYYSEFLIDDSTIELYEQYENDIDLIKQYIEQNGIYNHYLSEGKFVISYFLETFNTQQKIVRLIRTDYSSAYIRNYFRTSNTGSFELSYGYYQCEFSINNNVVTCNTSKQGSAVMDIPYDSLVCNPIQENCIITKNNYYYDTSYLSLQYEDNTIIYNSYWDTNSYNIPIKIYDNTYLPTNNIKYKDFFNYYMSAFAPSEPTYSMTKNILENGDAKLTFEFQNYSSDTNYTFEIENRISGEYYGIANPYSSIFPNIIPYGDNFEITLSYDSVLYITLAQYNQLEDSELYYREEIYTDYIDVNNIVFENNQDPYFSVILQTKNTIAGNFHNTKSGQSCYYKKSNSNIISVVTCDEQQVYETFDFNGYIEFFIENSNGDTIYNRKINVLGGSLEQPYITYYVTKQDFYSLINWSVENYTPNNIYYRYSIDNGSNFTSWSLLSQKDNKLNIFENSTTIIEISDSNQNTIYDKKAIYVINSINTITEFNNTTNNFINKFSNLFTPNQNILKNVNDYWAGIRNSKLYFLIFIPFITSLICAIIHLIRRK